MLKIFLKILAILLLTVFQIALAPKFLILGGIPNLVLILAIGLTIKNRFDDAILVVLFGGLILDLASPLKFGIFTILFLIIILAINFLLLKSIPSPNGLIAFLIFMGSFLFFDLGIFLMIKVLPSWQIFLSSFVNALWAIIIYYLFTDKIFKEEEIKLI